MEVVEINRRVRDIDLDQPRKVVVVLDIALDVQVLFFWRRRAASSSAATG